MYIFLIFVSIAIVQKYCLSLHSVYLLLFHVTGISRIHFYFNLYFSIDYAYIKLFLNSKYYFSHSIIHCRLSIYMINLYFLQIRFSICIFRSVWLTNHKIFITCLTGSNADYVSMKIIDLLVYNCVEAICL